MTSEIVRISISLPKTLLENLDEFIKSKGYANRSEAIRDAIRDFITHYSWEGKEGEGFGVISFIYDHELPGITDMLLDLQHEFDDVINSTLHIHVDERNCLEIVIVRGEIVRIRELFDSIMGKRGVKQAKIMVLHPID